MQEAMKPYTCHVLENAYYVPCAHVAGNNIPSSLPWHSLSPTYIKVRCNYALHFGIIFKTFTYSGTMHSQPKWDLNPGFPRKQYRGHSSCVHTCKSMKHIPQELGKGAGLLLSESINTGRQDIILCTRSPGN